jgi:hypothetical protein
MTAARLEFIERLRQQRRRTGDEHPHGAADLGGEAGHRQQPGIKGRHAHHDRGARQQVQHLVGVEFRQENHAAAVQQHAMGGDEQPMGVEDRQSVQQHVVGPEAPNLVQHQRIGRQIAVAQHRALGPPGGAGGIQDRRDIVGRARHGREFVRSRPRLGGQRPLAVAIQREHGGPGRPLAE